MLPPEVLPPSVTTHELAVEALLPLDVSAHNPNATPLTLRASVVGVPAEWVVAAPARTLPPGARARVGVTLLAPRAPDSRAGMYAVRLKLHCLELPKWQATVRFSLRVEPFGALALAGSVGRAGQVRLVVTNEGNAPAPFVLAAPAPDVRVAGLPASGIVPAGASQPLLLAVEPPHGPRRATSLDVALLDERGHLAAQWAATLPPVPPPANWPFGLLVAVLLMGALGLGGAWWVAPSPRMAVPTPTVVRLPYAQNGGEGVPSAFARAPVTGRTRRAEAAPPVAVPEATSVPEQALRALAVLVAPTTPPASAIATPPPTITAPAAPPPTLTPGGAESYEMLLREVALLHGLDWRVLAAMVYQESRFNPRAVGRDGDMGLMQILPGTWEQLVPAVRQVDPWDPYSNVMAGAYFLRTLHERLGARGYPEIFWALAAYNWGPANVDRHLAAGKGWEALPVEVQRYAWLILQDAAHQEAAWWRNELQRAVAR